jgi:undecaprenyl-diphosphatase
MNPFDYSNLHFFNQFVGQFPRFDYVMDFLSDNDLLKGGIVMMVYWWLWFRHPQGSNESHKTRTIIFAALVLSLVAVLLARGLALSLPFRERPIRNEAAAFTVPSIVPKRTLEGWSAFPSDHATLFFGLATGLFLVHRLLGILGYFHAAFIICFPRIYLLYHHPTDILVGALLGMSCVLVGNLAVLQRVLIVPVLDWLLKRAAWFYSLFFLLTYQTAETFDSTRDLAKFLYGILRGLLRRLG